MGELAVGSLTEGWFMGGARILHAGVIGQLHGNPAYGQQHAVLSIYGQVYRENTLQPMTDDRCYKELSAAGIAIESLGRTGRDGVPRQPYNDAELTQFDGFAANLGVLLSLKEQPLDLLNAAADAGMPNAGKPTIVCLHRSDPERQGSGPKELHVAVAAGRIALCTVSGYAAKEAYVRAGVPEDMLHVILNGVDAAKFRPSAELREAVRQELGIPQTAPTVLFSGRYDTSGMKDIPLFLASSRLFLDANPGAHVVLCGSGMQLGNEALRRDIAAHFGADTGLAKRLHLMGIRTDIPRMYAAADVVGLTSAFGETYPLCLIEGMMCGAVPVATDVGDTRRMLIDGQRHRGVITPREPTAIAAAWRTAHENHGDFRLSPAERDQFSQDAMTATYGALIRSVAV